MDNYDVIVVGTGNSALVSALSLIKENLRVLILEEHNNVGGSSYYSKIGRFEFGNTIHNLYLNENSNNDKKIEDIFRELGIDDEVSFSQVPNICKVITHNQIFDIPYGIEEFIKKTEELVPGSIESLRVFFNLAIECREALKYIKENVGNIVNAHIKEHYYNFMKVSTYSISKVMDALEIPLRAQEIINSTWLLLGNSETEISFPTYATFLLNILENGYRVPSYNNYEISLTLLNKFLELGGELKLNSKVVEILVDDGKVNGVKLEDGTIYFANNVIVNSSLSNVYNNMIDSKNVSERALKNINNRRLGGRAFTVNLGLNRSASELGLDNYMYFIYQSLDSDVEYSRMRELVSGNQIAIVHNIANEEISQVGTCALSLTTVFFEDCFGEYIESERYYTDLREIVKRLIDVFEKNTGVKICEYIEEMNIVSPISTAILNDSPEGCTYGYELAGYDDLLPRILSSKNENYIDGLYTCGGFDGDAFGYLSSFVSGLDCRDYVMGNIEEAK